LLARSDRFDSAVIGASSGRQLQPETLNALFGSRFVNLCINAAYPDEQAGVLKLFLHRHPRPKTIIWGFDWVWYQNPTAYQAFEKENRALPDWLYEENSARHLMPFSLLSFTHSRDQLLAMLNLRQFPFGLNGYTDYTHGKQMTLDEKRFWIYGSATPKARQSFVPPVVLTQEETDAIEFPSEAVLKSCLAALPLDTEKILFFTPYHWYGQPVPGSRDAAMLGLFKKRLVRLASRYPNTHVLDFTFESPFTTRDDYFLDGLHSTVEAGVELAHLLYIGAREPKESRGEFRRLFPNQ
jgi:hypothetical protein